MSLPTLEQQYVYEDCEAVLIARLIGLDGSLVTQAALASIAYKVFDLDDGNRLVTSGAPLIASTVYDTAQSDASWPYSDGYNFRWIAPAACFPTGGHLFVVEIVFTTATGEKFAVVFACYARPLYGS